MNAPSRATAGAAACLALTSTISSAAGALYTNPVLALDWPDPAVLVTTDAVTHAPVFYTFATMGNGKHIQVRACARVSACVCECARAPNNDRTLRRLAAPPQCARSPDLVTWAVLDDALPTLPAWGSKASTWAPDVHEHGGTFFLYYAQSRADNGSMCVAVATSSSPAGPYTPAAAPVACGDSFAVIDPRVFDDAATNRSYLYYGSAGVPIQVQELAPSRTAVAPGSRPAAVVVTSPTAPYESLVEGAWVSRGPAGDVLLFYSGSNCCGPDAHYAVMVARAPGPLGPFVKLGQARGTGDSVVLASSPSGAVTAPGHNAVVTDGAGVDWMLYHANVGRCNASYCARLLFLDRVTYNVTAGGVAGWPTVGIDGAPSTTPQTAPFVRLAGM